MDQKNQNDNSNSNGHGEMSFDDQEEDQEVSINSCSICYSEPPVNAVQLNCGHTFCFLCIKSASETTGVCALCRQEIGVEFNFQSHDVQGPIQIPTSTDGNYWFYEGYRGWWMYDAETNHDIEDAYQRGLKQIDKFIAGYVYGIDLENLQQSRKNGDGRTRRICRSNLGLSNIIGISGLKGPDFEATLDMMRAANQMTSHQQPN